jgi:hypothetical protein
MTVFWDVAACSLVEDGHLHTRRRENLKTHQIEGIVYTGQIVSASFGITGCF